MPSLGDRWAGDSRRAGIRALAAGLLWTIGSCLGSARAQALELPTDELQLDNGMTILLVGRPGATTVAAGWVVTAGSADERPGKTGTSHLLEHLMFKGSSVIGSRDPDRERRLTQELDAVHEKLARRRADGSDDRVDKLQDRAAELETAVRDTTWPGQFSLFYSEQGAVDLNAHTLRDATIFYVTLPADRLELWFWLESDRLLRPVFRELYKEKRVIGEERRLRVEATPTGLLEERAEADFWGADPYSRPTLGLPGDLAALTRGDVRDFFDERYRPPHLTAVLVGDLDKARVKELAKVYFGRLTPGPLAPPRTDLGEGVPSRKEDLSGLCDCPTQIRVRYPTVPFGHPDSYALDLLAGVLNGRSGRLFRDLVAGREIAFSAFATHSPLKRKGYFEFQGEVRGETRALDLAEAWEDQVARLRRDGVQAAELQRVKNRSTADVYRELEDPSALLRRLLIYQGLGDWRQVELWPDRVARVGPEEIRRVANAYLTPERRFRAIFENREDRGTAP